ncbi:hypothetical protein [Bacteroides caecimuris]|uniref:hypothetical protein n=1 Tax=Bacteroides caecimuris TaxID=1796613 RepID=UPI0026650621|nr:hypothetical protein [Bacteroides caecimuris]
MPWERLFPAFGTLVPCLWHTRFLPLARLFPAFGTPVPYRGNCSFPPWNCSFLRRKLTFASLKNM